MRALRVAATAALILLFAVAVSLGVKLALQMDPRALAVGGGLLLLAVVAEYVVWFWDRWRRKGDGQG